MGLFRKNDRVSFNGRLGTVVGIMPNQMIDIRFDDRGQIERRSSDRLRLEQTGLARRNPSDEEEEGYVAGRITPKTRKQPPDEPFIQLSEGVRLFPAGSQAPSKGVIKFPAGQAKSVNAEPGTSLVSTGGPNVVLDLPENQAKALQIVSDPRSSTQDKEYAASLVPKLIELKTVAGPTMSDFEWLSYLASLRPEEYAERVTTLTRRVKVSSKVGELRLGSEETHEQFIPEKEKRGTEQEQATRPIESLKVQKTGFIRKTAVDTSVDAALKSAKAAVFIQDDPPRMAPDNESICGNPIDGNAYYIVVAEEMPRSISFWVKKSDVEKSIGSVKFKKYADLKRRVADYLEGRYSKNVYPVAGTSQVRKTIRPRGTVGGGLDPKLMIRQKRAEPLYAELDPSVAFALADEQNVHTVKRGETIQQLAIRYAVAGDPKSIEANIRRWNHLPAGEPTIGQALMVYPAHNVKEGETIQQLAARYTAPADLKVAEANIRRWNNIPVGEPRIGQVLMVYPPHTVMNGETIQQLAARYAVGGNLKSAEANIRRWNNLPEGEPGVGQRLLVHPAHAIQGGETIQQLAARYARAGDLELTEANIRRWNNLREGEPKVGQQLLVHPVHKVKPGETIQQLAIQYARAGDPRAAEANIRLWNDLPEGEPNVGQTLFVHPVYFKVSKRQSATEGALSRFDMYQRRFVRLAGPESFKAQDVTDFGALTLSVLHAFRSDPSVGINLSRPLVQAMIRSGWVSINFQPVLDPFYSAYDRGSKATISYPWKANNPFFSWVRSDVAIGPEGIPTGEKPCLSQTDLYVKEGLQVLRSMLRKLDSAFGRTRSLFDRLANNPELFRVGENGDVFYAVQSLSTAIAGLVRWEARLQESVSVGDPKAIALRNEIINIQLPREDGELSPVLDSSIEGSFWGKLLTGFQTSSDSLGLVGYDGLMRTHVGGSPRLYAANIAKLVNKLQRSGINVTRIDKKQGAVEYIIPRTKVKSEIYSQDPRDSEEAYEKFRSYMDGLLNSARFRRMDDEGKPILPEPGASALNFFKGENEHPVSDLYAFILPSLDSESAGVLNTYGESTREFGINQFRNSLPPDDTSGKLQQDAFKFSEAVGIYASGGVRTRQQQTTDPLVVNKLFHLRPPPSLQHPFEDQKDYNWVIHLVVNEVFPSLKARIGVTDAMRSCADLLLLAYLYRMAGGYELAGPLNPANQQGSNPLFRMIVAELLRLEAKLSGGSSSLNEYKVRTVYMTYNPVLFQVTRLYWPTLGEYIVPPSKAQVAGLKVGDVQAQEQGIQFSNVLAYPQLSMDIDRVGVYGLVAQTTQSVVINSQSEEEVTKKLGDLAAGRVVDQSAELILRNKWVQVATDQLFNVPKDWYELFLATWPLGDGFEEAEQKSEYWATSPLEYLAGIKQEADQAIARGSRLARVGVMPEKHEHTPTGRMPVVFRRPVDEGALMEQADEQRKMRVHREAIDKLIAEQKKKLGGP